MAADIVSTMVGSILDRFFRFNLCWNRLNLGFQMSPGSNDLEQKCPSYGVEMRCWEDHIDRLISRDPQHVTTSFLIRQRAFVHRFRSTPGSSRSHHFSLRYSIFRHFTITHPPSPAVVHPFDQHPISAHPTLF